METMFVIVSVHGDNIPNTCWGPFISVEHAIAWLSENGYRQAKLYGSDQGGMYFEKEFGGHESYVWIRKVQTPGPREPYSHPSRLIT